MAEFPLPSDNERGVNTYMYMYACWYVRMYIVHSLASDSLVLCQSLRLPLLLPSFPLSLSSSHLSRLQYQSARELFESGEEGKGRAAMQCQLLGNVNLSFVEHKYIMCTHSNNACAIMQYRPLRFEL